MTSFSNRPNRIAIPVVILDLLKKPPLLKGENTGQFFTFFGSVVEDPLPNDMIDWLWSYRFVICAWEELRWRRLRNAVVNARSKSVATKFVRHQMFPNGDREDEVERNRINQMAKAAGAQWSTDPSHIPQYGLDPDIVVANAVIENAREVALFDRLLEKAQQQSDDVIRQLELRRDVFASRAFDAAARLIEGRADLASSAEPILLPPPAKATGEEAQVIDVVANEEAAAEVIPAIQNLRLRSKSTTKLRQLQRMPRRVLGPSRSKLSMPGPPQAGMPVPRQLSQTTRKTRCTATRCRP